MTSDSFVSNILTTPNDVQAMRCGLFVDTAQSKQFSGFRLAVNQIREDLANNVNNLSKQARPSVDKQTQLSLTKLSKLCAYGTIPLDIKYIPEGSTLGGQGGIVATATSTDEEFPWLPLLLGEQVSTIETATRISSRILALKERLITAIEKTVDDDIAETVLAESVRTDVENYSEHDLRILLNTIYPHFKTKNLNTLSFLQYQTPLEQGLKEHKLAMYSKSMLDTFGYSYDTYKDFFKERKDLEADPGLSFGGGFKSKEPSMLASHLDELVKEIGRTFYVQLESEITTKYGPLYPQESIRLSQLSPSDYVSQIIFWLSKLTLRVEHKTNSKGYKVFPVKTLIPFPSRSSYLEFFFSELEVKKISIENIIFFPDKKFVSKASLIESSIFSYYPIAIQKNSKWEKLGKDPIDPHLMFDKEAKLHATIDPNEILLVDGLNLVDEMQHSHGTIFDSLNQFRYAETTKESFIIPEREDPLLQ